MVSEHASPLAVLGGVDAGGQNVHVAALATALGRRGDEVVVHTRRDDPALPRRVPLAPNVEVDHVCAGPPTEVPKDELLPHMEAFADDLREQWLADPPDIVHSHFWMSAVAALDPARGLRIPVVPPCWRPRGASGSPSRTRPTRWAPSSAATRATATPARRAASASRRTSRAR